MTPRDQLVEALHACLEYVQATSDITEIWPEADQDAVDGWRKAVAQIREVIRQALAADQADRN